MKLDLMNMSALELDVLEENTSVVLETKLRQMVYDDHLDELFLRVEEIKKEKQRRGITNG